MTEVHYYKIYCTSDSKFEYVWGTSNPTKCPSNTAHTVDTNSVAIVKTISDTIVTVKEEDTPTGGHFKVETISMVVSANETKSMDVTWPMPISVLEVTLHPSTAMEGDKVSVVIAPNTTIGVLTANAAVNDTILNVSSTVLTYAQLGYYITVTDGTNLNQCNRVKNVDVTNSQITIETALTNSFSASTPTYVQLSVYMMKDYEIGPSGMPLELGSSKIGGSYIPANKIARLKYENTTSASKTFRAAVEYLY